LEYWGLTHLVTKLFKSLPHIVCRTSKRKGGKKAGKGRTVSKNQSGRSGAHHSNFLGPVTTALLLESTKMQWIGPRDFLLIRTWEEEAVRISV
jgi:hypothetical protein